MKPNFGTAGRSHSRVFLSVHILLPLVLGGFIYICWRETNLLMFRWLGAVGLDPLTNALRSLTAPAKKVLPHWFVYSLPDGLWVYALTSFMLLVWRNTDSLPTKMLWCSLGLLLGAGIEIGQLAGVVPGTFDYGDLIVCLIAPTAAFLFTSRKFMPGNLVPEGV
jgi:hypothetical protein